MCERTVLTGTRRGVKTPETTARSTFLRYLARIRLSQWQSGRSSLYAQRTTVRARLKPSISRNNKRPMQHGWPILRRPANARDKRKATKLIHPMCASGPHGDARPRTGKRGPVELGKGIDRPPGRVPSSGPPPRRSSTHRGPRARGRGQGCGQTAARIRPLVPRGPRNRWDA